MSANATDGEQERIRSVPPIKANRRIDRKTEESVRCFAAADKDTLTGRLRELEKECDVERVLEANAAGLALTGLVLSRFRSRWWLLLPAVVLAFLVQHAFQGWCPPIPVFRRLHIRTRGEVEQERTAIKALRGDFDEGVLGADPKEDPEQALAPIRA